MPEPTPRADVITLRLPSRLELLGVLDRLAQALCERMEFDEATTGQVTLSVIEAGTNAIQHGHQRDASRMFEVVFQLFQDRMVIDVSDSGTGFDVDAVNGDVTSPEHLLDERGRGLFIMRNCMDSVEFEFGDEGTVCHLVKHRPASTD